MDIATVKSIRDVTHLEDLLSEPTTGAIETMGRLKGDILILGVAGKIGPSLARMAKRASDAAGTKRRIIGVARKLVTDMKANLEEHGIETIICDLLDQAQLDQLPDAPNVIYMPAMKFGATGQEALTWALNTYLPGMAAKRFRQSRIVAYSTGNIYGLSPVTKGGSVETDVPCPVGEYAMSCLGRERIFQHFSQTLNIPISLFRLNYATEMRYGVLIDLAQQVWADQPINVNMGYFNILWQGDSNAMTLQSFEHAASPPFLINATGPDILTVREVCTRLGQLMKKDVRFTGCEAPDALLNNSTKAYELFGHPRVTADQLIRWSADWTMRGGPLLGKPTHFENREGKF
ncbi:MAG: NAD(P)-dependent oxidoreductase [Phycisphaerales bacterium]|nr:NAD(P)-dependent oxidoreductase [Phycisphaerales bacterium]